jgi:DNA polymerase I-like protein with 3'-5' exonuclease and polymerase domains
MATFDNIENLWAPDDDRIMRQRPEREGKASFNPNVPVKDGYEPPKRYDSILSLPRIGLDIETWDPDLTTLGPGARRPKGFIVGVGVGPRSNIKYYPIKHGRTGRNIDFEFWDRFKSEVAEFDGELVGANLQYDLDWLGAQRQDKPSIIFHRAKIRDVQIAEPLLNENRFTYKLNALAKDYLGEAKADLATAGYGKGYIENMHLVDPGHADYYCVQDIALALDIYALQVPELERQGLWDLFVLESKLIPLLLRMRSNGVRVDIDRVEAAIENLTTRQRDSSKILEMQAGMPIDIWSSESIKHAFDKNDIGYPTTAAGRPSFTKDWLNAQTHPIAKLIVEQRELDKIKGTFLQNYMMNSHIDGRIFCQFNQLKSDEGGTVSGRFSSSYPNLQNIPARHPELGPLCRGLFIPEEGMLWGCTDWSQIEFRFLVHYAVSTFYDYDKHDHEAIKSALAAAEAYRTDPSTDFHKIAAAIAGTDRKQAKNINFGVVYGMGVPKMAASLGKSISEAEPILNEFHTRMPFLRKLYDRVGKQANDVGFIKTILGRRRRFHEYEVVAWPKQRGGKPPKFVGNEEACYQWLAEKEAEGLSPGGSLRRAYTHKALNSLLQGSAADLMKKSMVDMWESGIFETIIPHLTVHDELDVSVPQTPEGAEAFEELKHMMAIAIPLKVPVFASASTGGNWDEAKGD